MARVFVSGSHKGEARKDRRIAARTQAHIPRSPLTRLSRDRNAPAKASTLVAPREYFRGLVRLQDAQTVAHPAPITLMKEDTP